MLDDKPEFDVVDQRRPAQPEDLADEVGDDLAEDYDFAGVGDLAGVGDDVTEHEADPADVVDQRRVAPVLAEDEPWP